MKIAEKGFEMGEKDQMKLWFDITNTPRVHFFVPIIRFTMRVGHKVIITSRDFAETKYLLNMYGFDHKVVGKYYEKPIIKKLYGGIKRLLSLYHFVSDFDIAIGSENASQLAKLKFRKSIMFDDNEISNQMYHDFIKFDGNAQAIRVVTKLQNYNSEFGLDLCSSTIGGIVKYPYNSLRNKEKSKMGYFYSEKDIIDKLRERYTFIDDVVNPVALLMEAADDIACLVSDFEDAVKKKKITFEVLYNKFVTKFISDFKEYYKKNLLISTDSETLQTTISRMCKSLRNELIYDVCDIFYENYETIMNGVYEDPLKRFSLISKSEHQNLITMIENLIRENVYNDHEIVSAELEGDVILNFLLEEFMKAVLEIEITSETLKMSKLRSNKVLQLLSKSYINRYLTDISKLDNNDANYNRDIIYYKLRLITDQVCGMTDSFAKDTYRSLRGLK